jgi:RNA polymerase sigma factor (sigma-70 family)
MTPRRLIEPARLAGAALLHTQSDERLVDLARSGNDRAFEAIVARYRRPLLRYCRRLLPPERAEDAVQQALMNAYRAIGAGEADLNLRPWLYRIAHNASLSLLRQNGWNHEQINERLDGVQQPPQALEQRERVREVVQAVKGLLERQRDAMILRELEGRSYEEIAAELGVSGGAVRQLLNRARTNLRAAATTVTPWGFAELCAGGAAGAGGLTAAAKLATALVVAGAVAGGTTGAGPLPSVLGGGEEGGSPDALAAEADAAAGDDALSPRDQGGLGGDGRRDPGDDRRDDEDDRDEDDRDRDDDSGRGGGDDESSGAGDDRSGPSGSGSDSSGPGGGGDSGSGSSGSGSGSSGDSGSSGSGSDSSGPGGGGESGSGSSDSGSSGSGSSGSGSGSSGSGSGSSDSSRSGSGSTSSGSGSAGGDSGSGTASGSGSSGSGSGTGSSGSGSGDSTAGSSGSG